MTGGQVKRRPVKAATDEGQTVPGAIARCGTLAVEPRDHRIDGDLWENSSPHTMARTTLDLFGPAAIEAAAWCALSAYRGGRHADLGFWLAVFDLLDVPPPDEEREQ